MRRFFDITKYANGIYYIADNYQDAYLWKDGTWHTTTADDETRFPQLIKRPGFYSSEKEAQQTIAKYLASLSPTELAEMTTRLLS